jgi:hypothetical protein
MDQHRSALRAHTYTPARAYTCVYTMVSMAVHSDHTHAHRHMHTHVCIQRPVTAEMFINVAILGYLHCHALCAYAHKHTQHAHSYKHICIQVHTLMICSWKSNRARHVPASMPPRKHEDTHAYETEVKQGKWVNAPQALYFVNAEAHRPGDVYSARHLEHTHTHIHTYTHTQTNTHTHTHAHTHTCRRCILRVSDPRHTHLPAQQQAA